MCSICGNYQHVAASFEGATAFDPIVVGSLQQELTPFTGASSKTTQQAAETIARGEFWGDILGNAITLTYGFRSSSPSYVDSTFTAPNFLPFQEGQIEATVSALQRWSDVANIKFERVVDPGSVYYTNNATMLFGNYMAVDGQGAFGTGPGATENRDANSSQGDVWVNLTPTPNWPADQPWPNFDPSPGKQGYSILLHEIGHTLGLAHPGDYNAGLIESGPDKGKSLPISYEDNRGYWEDSQQFTVMSYFGASKTYANHAYYAADGTIKLAFASTPLLHDIAALQHLYGVNWETRQTATTYGFHSNAGEPYLLNDAYDKVVLSIWDAGGHDTLDFSGYFNNQRISLVPDTFSNVGGLTMNVSIAGVQYDNGIAWVWDERALIEDAKGGSGDDTITGNDIANSLWGNEGNDTLIGGGGNDWLFGGEGTDTASYDSSPFGVTVDLTPTLRRVGNMNQLVGTATSASDGTDILSSIENVIGSNNRDTIIGNDGNNVLSGRGGVDTLKGAGGHDTLIGGRGDDTLIGGDGSDTASYEDTFFGVNVKLAMGSVGNIGVLNSYGTAIGGSLESGTDKLYSIENVIGGWGDDTITGNNGANRLEGFAGKDTLSGLGGADILIGGLDHHNDTLDGGDGKDTADYSATTQGVEVWLDSHIVWGSTWPFPFSGPSASGAEIGTDTLNLIENVIGGSGKDKLHGNDKANVLDGRGGADIMEGGDSDDEYYVDTADKATSGPGGFSLEAGDQVLELPGQGTDTVHSAVFSYRLSANVENLVLSNHPIGLGFLLYPSEGIGNELANTITGNGSNNILRGAGGADTVIGGAGFDFLDGGDGLSGDGANDTLTGGLDADRFYYRDGDGTDTITDFNLAEGDTIDLTGVKGVYRLSDLNITQVGADAIITIGIGGLVLRNVAKDALTDSQFVFNFSPDIDLSNAAVAENSADGTMVGHLSATTLITAGSGSLNVDAIASFSLLDDADGRFALDSSNNLVVAGALDYETATSHNVRVRVTYSSGNYYDETFTIGVTDVPETMRGGAGSDVINVAPGSGIVAVEAGAGNDTITIAPGAGSVVVDAGTGNDVIVGNGQTILSFASSTNGITYHTGSGGGFREAVMKNLATGEVTPLQTKSGQTDTADFVSSVNPVFSPDGGKVALISTAALTGGRGGTWDVYVKDLATGQNTLVSTSATGALANHNSYSSQYPVAWSPDGTKIAFMSQATNLVAGDGNGLIDIFIKTIAGPNAGAIERVSTGTSGIEATDSVRGVAGFLDGSYGPKFSPDGRFLLFWSSAENFAADDTNGKADVFLKVLSGANAGTTYLISRDAAGVIGDGQSLDASFSPDGRSVVFTSNALNLGAKSATSAPSIFVKDISAVYAGGDPSNGALAKIPSFQGQGAWATFSPDGSKVLYYNGQIFIHDLAAGTNTVVSTNAAGVNGNSISQFASWSADGTKVSFMSYASNLVAGDTNGVADVFVKTVSGPNAGAIERVSVGADGMQSNANSLYPLFSTKDSNIVVFQTDANNIYTTGSNGNDKFSGIAAVWGSQFADTLLGNDLVSETFRGNAGNDLIQANNPNLVPGSDEADYSNSPAGITANLSVVTQGNGFGTVKDGWGTVDTLRYIENIRGSEFADTINMDDFANTVWGNGGNDVINGRGGNDVLEGGAGLDTLTGGRGSDIMTGGADADTFLFRAFESQAGDVDTVTDFLIGQDQLWFEGLTVTQLTQSDVNGDGVLDTALTFNDGSIVQMLDVNGFGDWVIPLLNSNSGSNWLMSP